MNIIERKLQQIRKLG